MCCRIGVFADAVWGGKPLAVFCLCAATTHLASAITHIYPDDHVLVRGTADAPPL
jgi:hypothetical protein